MRTLLFLTALCALAPIGFCAETRSSFSFRGPITLATNEMIVVGEHRFITTPKTKVVGADGSSLTARRLAVGMIVSGQGSGSNVVTVISILPAISSNDSPPPPWSEDPRWKELEARRIEFDVKVQSLNSRMALMEQLISAKRKAKEDYRPEATQKAEAKLLRGEALRRLSSIAAEQRAIQSRLRLKAAH